MELVQETYDCIKEIEVLLDESLELQQCGSVTIASSDSSLKGLEALEEAATRFGIPNERISRERVKELLPWIESDAVDVALYMRLTLLLIQLYCVLGMLVLQQNWE